MILEGHFLLEGFLTILAFVHNSFNVHLRMLHYIFFVINVFLRRVGVESFC